MQPATKAHDRRPARTFTGWHMLAVTVGFFTVVIAVNVTMAVFATGSWTGLVVKNSYVASQEYNGVLRDARAQAARGWTSELDYGNSRLSFALHSRAGTAIAGANAVATVSRPVGTEQDTTVTLIESRPGVYEHAIALGPGAWNVEIRAESGSGAAYRQVYRLRVKAAD